MLYDDLEFPDAPPDRPYTYANMVATIDGKTVLGGRGESVAGLGSKFDQSVMDVLESKADAILLGSGSIRANPIDWDPHCPIRIAVTSSGHLPWQARFFTGGLAIVAYPEDADFEVPDHVVALRCGMGSVDLRELLKRLRTNSPPLREGREGDRLPPNSGHQAITPLSPPSRGEAESPPLREGREGERFPPNSEQQALTRLDPPSRGENEAPPLREGREGDRLPPNSGHQVITPLNPPSRGENSQSPIRRLHILGGSELNAELLRQDLLDELFLTIAPKIKLGRDLPTYAGGDPLAKQELKQFKLVESHVVGDEVFLRYRRAG